MSEKPKNAWHNVYGVSSGELQNAGKETTERYGDILYAERPHSGRKKNSARSRAAQFLPFAALTGFETEIETEGRYTEERVELSAEELEGVPAGVVPDAGLGVLSGSSLPQLTASTQAMAARIIGR